MLRKRRLPRKIASKVMPLVTGGIAHYCAHHIHPTTRHIGLMWTLEGQTLHLPRPDDRLRGGRTLRMKEHATSSVWSTRLRRAFRSRAPVLGEIAWPGTTTVKLWGVNFVNYAVQRYAPDGIRHTCKKGSPRHATAADFQCARCFRKSRSPL
jgi:hypothetical protein